MCKRKSKRNSRLEGNSKGQESLSKVGSLHPSPLKSELGPSSMNSQGSSDIGISVNSLVIQTAVAKSAGARLFWLERSVETNFEFVAGLCTCVTVLPTRYTQLSATSVFLVTRPIQWCKLRHRISILGGDTMPQSFNVHVPRVFAGRYWHGQRELPAHCLLASRSVTLPPPPATQITPLHLLTMQGYDTCTRFFCIVHGDFALPCGGGIR